MALKHGTYLSDGENLWYFDGFVDGQNVAIENVRSNNMQIIPTRDFVKMKLKKVEPLQKGTKSRARGRKVKAKA